MNSFKIIFSSIIFAFGSIAYAECSNPKQQVPNLDNYWELKIAQGFNDMKVIKELDSKYCYNYLINNKDYGSPLFQMISLEQVDFFIQKIVSFLKTFLFLVVKKNIHAKKNFVKALLHCKKL